MGEIGSPCFIEQRGFVRDLLVTAHAQRSRGDPRRRGLFNRSVAVSTIDPVIPDVMAMIELHYLLYLAVLPGVEGAERVDVKCAQRQGWCGDENKHRHPANRV